MLKKILLIILTSLMLVGCGKSDDNSIETLCFSQPPFYLDNKTIRNEDVTLLLNETLEQDKEITSFDYKASEIVLDGVDSSIHYIVDGDDIVYKDIRFKGLVSTVNSIEQPYELNNFINFLIKTYNPYGRKEVEVLLYQDGGSESIGEWEVGASLSLHDSLLSHQGYVDIANKYSDNVSWNITLYVDDYKHTASLYGCKSYVLYNGTSTLVINMEQFDTVKEDGYYETTETFEQTIEQSETTE